MKYAQIRKFDVANGPGIRTSIFVTGCTHNCKGCFNKEYQSFSYGDDWTNKETEKVIEYLKDKNVSGLTLLGGEPFQNVDGLLEVIKEVKNIKKDIWAYSGYTFEEIINDPKRLKLLEEVDVLVDGKFVEEKKNLKLRFRGSSNQRILDCKRSLEEQKPIWLEEFK